MWSVPDLEPVRAFDYGGLTRIRALPGNTEFIAITAIGKEIVVRRQPVDSEATVLGTLTGPKRSGALFPVVANSTGTTIAFAIEERIYVQSMARIGSPARLVGRNTAPTQQLEFGSDDILLSTTHDETTVWSLISTDGRPLFRFDTPSPTGVWILEAILRT